MKCSRCGGEMTERLVRFCSCNAVPPILVENVPAFVCGTCGGEVFSDATVEVFERIRDGAVPRPRVELMHVYDFERAAVGEPTAGEFTGVSFEVAADLISYGAPVTSAHHRAFGLIEGTAPLGVAGEEHFIFGPGTSPVRKLSSGP